MGKNYQTTHEENEARATDEGVSQDAPVSIRTRLAGGYDLDSDVAQEIAPVATTEQTGTFPSMPPAVMLSTEAATADEIERQIRDLEARLDSMIAEGRERPEKLGGRQVPAARPTPQPTSERPSTRGVNSWKTAKTSRETCL